MLDSHSLLNEPCEYEGAEGQITGVKYGPLLTRKSDMTIKRTIKLRIKLNDGSRAFWTPPMPDPDAKGGE